MKNDCRSSWLPLAVVLLLALPFAVWAANTPVEQFDLELGRTYWFDLSESGIPGTVNDKLPDQTLHYVPFTYAGTVSAYTLCRRRYRRNRKWNTNIRCLFPNTTSRTPCRGMS